ncbi:MAG: MOSC domain-containing protein [Candidatus Promineofilum sp.]|nr:MOSC domain-containing protein [Promineifilum sp.]
MNVISVNIGRAQPIENAKSIGMTGIYKTPAAAPVRVTALGLADDAICDVKHHGGIDQAVYVFGQVDYDWWSAELARPLAPGTFGENLTVSELESTTLAIGDRLHLAEVVLEVTSPRIPCVTLAVRMGDPTFAKRFRRAERPGVYCRVLREGDVRVGEPVRLEPYTGPTLSIMENFRDFYVREWDEAMLRRHLAAPISVRERVELQERLAALLAA